MVSKDSAADYARSRIETHHRRFQRIVGWLDEGRSDPVALGELERLDGPFPTLDAGALGPGS